MCGACQTRVIHMHDYTVNYALYILFSQRCFVIIIKAGVPLHIEYMYVDDES